MNFVKNIEDDKEMIFSKLSSRTKDIERYFYIKKQYRKGNIQNNPEFQRVYKKFYAMNAAGLTPEFLKEYFRILSNKEINLKKILKKLYKIPRRRGDRAVHFSFSTKLLHTINNDLPIYDKLVGKFLNLKIIGKNKIDRINSCNEAYGKLKRLYNELINNRKIKKIILEFREKFNCGKEKISDTKILDFVIWAKGQLEK